MSTGRRGLTLAVLEAGAIAFAGLIAVIAALGRFAAWFVGSDLWWHLLPFAAAVLGLAVVAGALLGGWFFAHRWLAARRDWAAAAVALVLAGGAGWWAARPGFRSDVAALQALVGGQAAAERAAIAHQVYAAYRRANSPDLLRMFERAERYRPVLDEAAAAFSLDPALLAGVAAAESSFRPRRSRDGGRGLFQITAPPAAAERAARVALGVASLDRDAHRDNAFLGAATLRTYLDRMGGDVFLGLLAYNIGPQNGGLEAIMRQYGARDFVTIQPYLRQLPRDYPIRVLSGALAWRLWRRQARLPRYEEGDNAEIVQAAGIPGLD